MPGTIVTETDIKRIRATEMVALRVAGMTLEDIGKQYNCDPRTVKRYLEWAGKNGIIQSAETRILDELVPLAINTYKTALLNGDTFAAKHIIDKLGEMAERAEKRQGKNEDRIFDAWMKEREAKKKKEEGNDEARPSEGTPVGSVARPEERSIIDAEVLSEETLPAVGEDGPGGPTGGTSSAFVSADALLSEVE